MFKVIKIKIGILPVKLIILFDYIILLIHRRFSQSLRQPYYFSRKYISRYEFTGFRVIYLFHSGRDH
jgi:hypothetical protein